MINQIIQMFTSVSLGELFFIFFAKMIEVALSTLRYILINKGYRKQGAILSFFEIILWVFVASTVIMGMAEAPIKGFIYSLGFAVGVYLGSLLESRIALGQVLIQVISDDEFAQIMMSSLREKGYGVTSIKAEGRYSQKLMLIVFAKRLKKDLVTNLIHEIDENALIVVSSIDTLKGGYYPSWKRLGK